MADRPPDTDAGREPLVAFQAALKPSVQTPPLVDLPGRGRPPPRPRAEAALLRSYRRLPRRILWIALVCFAAGAAGLAWLLSGATAP
jgi:hypothetical protein